MSYLKEINIGKVLGVVSTVNSTNVTLGIGGVFTGTGEDVKDYKSIGINVISSHVSATDGMRFQFSSNGSNWDKTHSFTIPAATSKFFNIPVEAKYFRITYTNGGTGQTYFRLQAIYHATQTKESTLRLSEDIDGETAAQLGRMVMAGKINGVYRNVVLDNSTGVLPSISFTHHNIHDGDTFSYSEVTDVPNAAVRDVLIVTPNTTHWAHLYVEVMTEAEADYKFYEGTVTTGDGTACSEINRNRNLTAVTATTVITHTPTVAGGAEGTLLEWKHWGTGKGVGGAGRDIEEWVLKQGTKYLIRVTNATTSANQVSITLIWYEHTNIT